MIHGFFIAFISIVFIGADLDAIQSYRSFLEKIDLSHWKITLPVDSNNDGRPDSYGPDELKKLKDTDKLKPYFYEDEKGALHFYCETADNNATTPNSKYPRSELREQLTPYNNDVNWTMTQGGRMKGKLQVSKVSDGHKLMVMQIHGKLTKAQRQQLATDDSDAPPLLKINFVQGQIMVAYKVLANKNTEGLELLRKKAWTDAEHYYFTEEVGNDPFELEIVASTGKLEVILNGESKVFTDADLSVWPFENYFKAGNYLTTTEKNAYAEVIYYNLKVEH